MTKECVSCAARDGETTFPPKVSGKPRRCCDCLDERDGTESRIARPVMLTRASWWARERARKASPQLDMIDWLQA